MQEETKVEDEVKASSIYIPMSLRSRLNATIPWGVRGKFIQKLIETALDRIEDRGYEVLGGVIAGDYDPFQRR